MEAEKSKRAVIVGIFVAVGILIFLVAVFTLGGQQKTFVKAIELTAVFDDVSGLQQGNNVWFSGVKIGTVRKIEFVSGAQVKVTLHVEKKAQEFIRKDAKAKISTDGLIGNKIIIIYGGTQAAGSIEGGELLAVEKALSTDDMMATLQENNLNLIEITRDFKTISKKLAAGEGTLGKLLKDPSLFNELQHTIGTLQVAARNSNKLTENIADYTSKLHSPGTLANDLVSDTVIIPNLKRATEQLNLASANALALADNLKDATSDLDNTATPAGMVLHDEKTANELRAIIHNLNSSSVKLDENLEALQHNFLLRGFFKKREKAAAKAAKDSTAAAQKQ
ncbi:MAG: MlaD family protein [Chitinophagaceae bacterium]